MAPTRDDFEAMFAAEEDPWHFRSTWYEHRKRALTMACLPAPRYRFAFEPGCANGELSRLLALRCEQLCCSDGVPRAVQIARERLADQPHVQVSQGWVPQDWPVGQFDLIVLSEFVYYLTLPEFQQLLQRLRSGLLPGGTVLACHWRPQIDGCALDADGLHQRLHGALDLSRLSSLVEPDFRIDVWCGDARSVAQRDQLRSSSA
ncbi:nodulation S family protein [Ideonella azotifigens]|uniref:SAM-dependent methyltransferase n=1 Tax=Ideonella azotifigens TaxID=513160 RepID=A0ABN1JS52_9BURK|nr:SAM-dependent methyltransferase [Ideonella azotifigens]MCD2340872.1 nodulation S family protein [Ideonella azotifigens]